jgi:hypothetical protein
MALFQVKGHQVTRNNAADGFVIPAALVREVLAQKPFSDSDDGPFQADDVQRPPVDAGRLLAVFLSPHQVECLLGDLQEGYEQSLRGAGRSAASRWYYRQVALSFLSFALAALKRVSGIGRLFRVG